MILKLCWCQFLAKFQENQRNFSVIKKCKWVIFNYLSVMLWERLTISGLLSILLRKVRLILEVFHSRRWLSSFKILWWKKSQNLTTMEWMCEVDSRKFKDKLSIQSNLLSRISPCNISGRNSQKLKQWHAESPKLAYPIC